MKKLLFRNLLSNYSLGIILSALQLLISITNFGQLPSPQIPQSAGFAPIQTGQGYPVQNNYIQQSFPTSNQNYPRILTAQDIMNQRNSNNPYYGQTLDQKKNQQTANEKILAELQNDPAYQTPNASNGFKNIAFEREKAMVDLLHEVNDNYRAISEMEYYSSSRYLNDLPNYVKAKDLINGMLQGKKPLSIKDAFYFSESAYGNLPLTYDEYNNIIMENSDFIRKWVTENGYDINDPEALHLGIQKFLSDSICISNKNNSDKGQIAISKQGHSPFYYDYIDNLSEKDRKNYFVSKMLATGSGQCHTFPITYLILAENLGAEAYLAYNPVHSFIRYKNNKGTVLNYETTVDRFLPDQFYLETLPVMATAQKNNIYINSLNKQQVVASVLFDLAVNFILEHWLGDKSFIKECKSIASPFFPNQDFINTANDYLNKRLYADDFNNKVREKGIKDLSEIEKYPDLLESYHNYRNYMENTGSLGIQGFPESEYLRILEYYDYKSKLQTAKKIDAKSKKNLFFTQ